MTGRERLIVGGVLAALCLGWAVGGANLMAPPGPRGAEVTDYLMILSWTHDRDFRYDHRDFGRARQLWGEPPEGAVLALSEDGGALPFAGSVLYGILGEMPYRLFGTPGPRLLNVLLWLVLCFQASTWLRRRDERAGLATDRGAGLARALVLAGGLFVSASFVWVFRADSLTLAAALVFAAVASELRPPSQELDRRMRAVVTGALLAAAISIEGWAVLALLGVAARLIVTREWQRLGRLLGGAVLASIVLAGLTYAFIDRPHAAFGPRASVMATGYAAPVVEESRTWLTIGVLEDLRDGIFGRHFGLVVDFPIVLWAVLAGAWAWRRWRGLALAAALLLLIAALPPPALGFDAVANRRFGVLAPALLLLAPPWRPRWSFVAPWLAVALWTASATGSALAGLPGGAVEAAGATFRPLPLESPAVPGRLPGFVTRSWRGESWHLPRTTVFADDGHPNGFWVRGASRSEIWFETAPETRVLPLRAHSLAAGGALRISSAGGSVVVRFDDLERLQGAPIRVPLGPGRRLGEFRVGHRLRIEMVGGRIASEHYPGSPDDRFLGAFLDLTGQGP